MTFSSAAKTATQAISASARAVKTDKILFIIEPPFKKWVRCINYTIQLFFFEKKLSIDDLHKNPGDFLAAAGYVSP